MDPNERVAVFIDGSNLYHGLTRVIGPDPNPDYRSLANVVCDGRKLFRVYFYTAKFRDEDDKIRAQKQQRFISAIERLDYFQVTLGRLMPRGTDRTGKPILVEKGVDVNLAVDMVSLAYKNCYDTAVLVSGDADFASAVKVVKDIGKHVECAFVRSGLSDQLRQTCDRVLFLEGDLLKKILMPKAPGSTPAGGTPAKP